LDIPLPPKIVRRHEGSRLPTQDPGNGAVGMPLAGGLAKNGESLPVLEAFQNFLDQERQKTRKRIMAVSIVFLILIAVAGGAAVAAGLLLAGQMKKDVQGMQDQVTAVRTEAQKVQADMQNALVAFTAKTDELREEMTKAQTSEDSELTAKLSAYSDELAKLSATLQAVEEENSLLKGDVVSLKTGFPAFSNDIRRVIQDLLQARQHVAPIAVPVAAVAKPANKAPAVCQDLDLAITPANTGRTVPWCIPIPE